MFLYNCCVKSMQSLLFLGIVYACDSVQSMLNPMQDLLPLAKIYLKNAFCFKPVWFFETDFVGLYGLEVLQQLFLCRIIRWLSKNRSKCNFMFQRRNLYCILIYAIDRNTNNQNNFLIPNNSCFQSCYL